MDVVGLILIGVLGGLAISLSCLLVAHARKPKCEHYYINRHGNELSESSWRLALEMKADTYVCAHCKTVHPMQEHVRQAVSKAAALDDYQKQLED